jgi:hypothetical protein
MISRVATGQTGQTRRTSRLRFQQTFQFRKTRWRTDFVKTIFHFVTRQLFFAHESGHDFREIERLIGKGVSP